MELSLGTYLNERHAVYDKLAAGASFATRGVIAGDSLATTWAKAYYLEVFDGATEEISRQFPQLVDKANVQVYIDDMV